VIWWMYGGYAWLTNAVAPDRTNRRLLLLGGMAAYLVLALAIPQAFSGSGLTFGLAYLAIVLVHAFLFSRSTSVGVVQAILRIVPFNVVTAGLVLAGGIAGGTAEYVLMGLAGTIEWITPRLTEDSGFQIGAAHFVERHGLVVIVAIGESVVAIGIGAAGLPVDLALVAVATVGLALSACLWWAHFGSGDDERAERALANAPAGKRPRLAIDAFGYWHLPLLFGVIAVAAGQKRAIGHAFQHLSGGQALELAGGVALFLIANVLYRRTLQIEPIRTRIVAAVLALATVPLGLEVSAFAQLVALVALLVAALAVEGASP
jgi:low temperature requirement protein LtrA